MSARRLALLGVPSSAGARRNGQEEAPSALRAAGLVRHLRKHGFAVDDLGDLARVPFRPDPARPRARNRDLVVHVAREVAERIEGASVEGTLPLVLGGDCTVTLGVVAGLVGREPDLGLVYFDADLDLNTPETTPSGVFDGMVTAHLLGRGDPEVAGFGPRRPLLPERRLAYFGYDVSSGAIDPPELQVLARSEALRVPIDRVRTSPRAAAEKTLGALESRSGRILVHFDVDVTNTPAVDVDHPGSLELETAAAALEVFLSSPRLAGLVVTELNPQRDPGGAETRRLARRLAAALQVAGAGAGASSDV